MAVVAQAKTRARVMHLDMETSWCDKATSRGGVAKGKHDTKNRAGSQPTEINFMTTLFL